MTGKTPDNALVLFDKLSTGVSSPDPVTELASLQKFRSEGVLTAEQLTTLATLENELEKAEAALEKLKAQKEKDLKKFQKNVKQLPLLTGRKVYSIEKRKLTTEWELDTVQDKADKDRGLVRVIKKVIEKDADGNDEEHEKSDLIPIEDLLSLNVHLSRDFNDTKNINHLTKPEVTVEPGLTGADTWEGKENKKEAAKDTANEIQNRIERFDRIVSRSIVSKDSATLKEIGNEIKNSIVEIENSDEATKQALYPWIARSNHILNDITKYFEQNKNDVSENPEEKRRLAYENIQKKIEAYESMKKRVAAFQQNQAPGNTAIPSQEPTMEDQNTTHTIPELEFAEAQDKIQFYNNLLKEKENIDIAIEEASGTDPQNEEWLRMFRRTLNPLISTLEDPITELKDRKANPLKWFTADKVDPVVQSIIGLADENKTDQQYEDITLWGYYKMLGKNSTYELTLNGFLIQVENVDEIRNKERVIIIDDPKARFRLVGPDNQIIENNLDLRSAQTMTLEKAKELQKNIYEEYKQLESQGKIPNEKIEELESKILEVEKEYHEALNEFGRIPEEDMTTEEGYDDEDTHNGKEESIAGKAWKFIKKLF